MSNISNYDSTAKNPREEGKFIQTVLKAAEKVRQKSNY